jgi:hypothetical protein
MIVQHNLVLGSMNDASQHASNYGFVCRIKSEKLIAWGLG